jgi:predicted lipid-binding transport protein (Tim44 family)
MIRILGLLAVLFGMNMIAVDTADAARFGGGRSFGRQSSGMSQRQAAPVQRSTPPQQTTPQKAGMSRWLGPLAGLAAGFGLASLFGHGAFGALMGGLLMLMLLFAVAVIVFKLFGRGNTAQRSPLQYAGAGTGNSPAPQPAPAQYSGGGGAVPGSLAATLGGTASAPAAGQWPADFDAAEFERQALLNFQRLQSAHDAGDISTLRDFLTPELYREMESEMKSAWGTPQKTEAVDVAARVQDVVTEDGLYVVSVNFKGQVRENGVLNDLNEVWFLEKPVDGRSGWRVAGIKQAS